MRHSPSTICLVRQNDNNGTWQCMGHFANTLCPSLEVIYYTEAILPLLQRFLPKLVKVPYHYEPPKHRIPMSFGFLCKIQEHVFLIFSSNIWLAKILSDSKKGVKGSTTTSLKMLVITHDTSWHIMINIVVLSRKITKYHQVSPSITKCHHVP